MTGLVSVIIPTYDRAEYVRRAIESVEAQTYDDLHVHLVETPAKDGGRPIDTEEFTIPIDHVITAPDVNATEARNIGLERAEGDYVAFLDDDDWWEPTKVEQQVEQLDETPSAVRASVSGHRKVKSGGETINEVVVTEYDDWVERGIGASIGTFSMLMVERSAALEVGGLDESLPVYEDHDFTLRLAKAGVEYAVIEDLLVNKYVGDHDQLGGDYDAKAEAAPIFMQKHGELAEQHGVRDDLESYFEFFAGRSARSEGRYLTAISHFGRCVALNPTKRATLELLATLGGPVTYRAGQYVAHRLLRGQRVE